MKQNSGFNPQKMGDMSQPENPFPIGKNQKVLGQIHNKAPQAGPPIMNRRPVTPVAPVVPIQSIQPEVVDDKKKHKVLFAAPLIIADRVTSSGNVYTRELCYKLIERFSLKPYIIVQELNPLERQLKHIPLSEPWDKKIMGVVKKAEMVADMLVISVECRLTRDGKKLAGMVQTLGINDLEFMPVGYGMPDNLNRIGLDYRLNYIAVEPRAKGKK